MADRVGKQFGNYRLVALLGRGSFAEVYLGQHLRLNQQVAIKVLHAHLTDTEAQHFQQEAQTIATLVHPSIVRVFDYDVQEGVPFLVMDYAPNGSLRRYYPKGTVVLFPQIISPVKQIADALQYAHDHKFIHRDVKPENMLLGRQQEVLLSDFGLVALAHSSASLSTQEAVGTLSYMAPEQIEGHPRPASDQYALGCMVYEWLCGARPFEGSSTEVMVQQLSIPPPSLRERNPTIPLALEQVVLRALAKDPKDRFASVHDFATALEQASQFTSSHSVLLPSEQHAPGPAEASSYATVAVPKNRPATKLEQVYKKVVPAETAPSQVWNVPYQRNLFFTGREELLKQLHENLMNRKAVALTQAISGLGGIGKTQTAVEYAYRSRDEYHDVLWVNAATRDTLIASFLDLARLLNLAEKEEPDQNITVQAMRRWLEQYDHWLLIVDNADELSLAYDFLPTGNKGHILLTTRTQALGPLAKKIGLEKMEKDEGMLFLLRRAGVLTIEAPLSQAPETDRVAAETIVKEMDGLPLALDQAGAYIEETGCSLSGYLDRYRQREFNLLNRRGEFGSEHPDPVGTTWSLSFEQVEQQSGMAANLLRFCAFLFADAIPEEMIVAGATQLGPLLTPLATDHTLLDDAIAVLRRFSLVGCNSNEKALSLHRLVQVVLRGSMNEQTRHEWAERTVRAVNLAFPDVTDVKAREQGERYLPHALVCATLIKEYSFEFAEASRLLTQTAHYIYTRAQYPQAEPLYQRALAIREQQLGPEHPDTAQSLNSLAVLYYEQGKYEQAELLHQRALTIVEKQLGPEHPTTATIRENYKALVRDMQQKGKGQH